MAVKRTGQLSFVEAMLPEGLKGSSRLDRLVELVKWYRFEKLLGRLRDEGPGRPGYLPLLMFKSLLLQSLYGLSDAELEEALCDRLSFRRFVGLGLEDEVPDHTTLCRFRLKLIEAGLLEKLFAELDRQLDAAGLILRRGTMLDATLIETGAASRPRGETPAVDPDARLTSRKGKPGTTYGYKAHVGVDEGSGLIRAVITTPANVNDTVPADRLILGDEKVVWADAAYHTHAREAALKARGVKARLARRPNKNHPELPPRLKRYNRLIARRRSAVETTFATWKRRMGLTAIRYVGLTKASAQVILVAMAFNLRRWATLAPA
jgi:transposase, IS5 family